MSNFLENDALPIILVATIGLFILFQVIRWIRGLKRGRGPSDDNGGGHHA